MIVGRSAERPRRKLVAVVGGINSAASTTVASGAPATAALNREAEARALVDKAHEEALRALGELRDLVHGIYPATLRERGLGAMLAEIVDAHPLPVTLHAELPRRSPPGTEPTMYFAISEALSNVAKHSGATTATVAVTEAGGRLVATVTDDGVGGAGRGPGPARGAGGGWGLPHDRDGVAQPAHQVVRGGRIDHRDHARRRPGSGRDDSPAVGIRRRSR